MAIAAEAAHEIMAVYGQAFSVDYKTPSDPVTEADRRANELICHRLGESFPGVPIVAEESPPEEWSDYRESEKVFFVDPVDGTREFVARSGNFVVMIGLLTGDRPSHGVIHSPVSGKYWAAAPSVGAFRKERDGSVVALAPLGEKPLADARVLSSRSQNTPLHAMALELLNPAEILPVGSTGLKCATLADGNADIYLAPQFAGSRWDSCAPEAIIRSLGGLFTDARGVPLDYRAAGLENNRGAVAASPLLHGLVIDRLSGLVR